MAETPNPPSQPEMAAPEASAPRASAPGASAPEAPAVAQPATLLDRLWVLATPVKVGLLIAVAYGTFGVATLHHYGLTVDSPSLFYAGDRTLFWMQHLKQAGALDFLGADPANFKPDYERFPDIKDPVHYPVVPGFTAAITNYLFHQKLKWLNAMDGHHLGLVLLNALALFLFCLYACKLLGRGAGILATLALALFPSAIGHAPNNPKDWPCAQFYGIAVLAAGVGVVQEKARHLLVAAVMLGLSLAAKMNGAFVMPTVVAWAPWVFFALHFHRQPVTSRVVGAFLLAPYVAFLVFFVTWPWLYYGPLPHWLDHLSDYLRFVAHFGVGARKGFTGFSFLILGSKTPPLLMLAGALFLFLGWRGGRRNVAVWSLLLLWLVVPIVRIALPHSSFYDSNRHFIEYVPAVAAMAGAGAMMAWTWIRERLLAILRGRLRLATGGALAMVWGVALVWPVAEYHPFEQAYFNFFVGGLGGAQRSGLYAMPRPQDGRVNGSEGDFWFASARLGAQDLRRFLPKDANLRLAMCGPARKQAEYNWIETPVPYFWEATQAEFKDVDYIYACPRETACWWRQIRKWETERPLLLRVERGGGLIYEILGPKDGKFRPSVSPETWYDRNTHPDDTEGQAWLKEAAERAAAHKAQEAAKAAAPAQPR